MHIHSVAALRVQSVKRKHGCTHTALRLCGPLFWRCAGRRNSTRPLNDSASWDKNKVVLRPPSRESGSWYRPCACIAAATFITFIKNPGPWTVMSRRRVVHHELQRQHLETFPHGTEPRITCSCLGQEVSRNHVRLMDTSSSNREPASGVPRLHASGLQPAKTQSSNAFLVKARQPRPLG